MVIHSISIIIKMLVRDTMNPLSLLYTVMMVVYSELQVNRRLRILYRSVGIILD